MSMITFRERWMEKSWVISTARRASMFPLFRRDTRCPALVMRPARSTVDSCPPSPPLSHLIPYPRLLGQVRGGSAIGGGDRDI